MHVSRSLLRLPELMGGRGASCPHIIIESQSQRSTIPHLLFVDQQAPPPEQGLHCAKRPTGQQKQAHGAGSPCHHQAVLCSRQKGVLYRLDAAKSSRRYSVDPGQQRGSLGTPASTLRTDASEV